MSDEWQKLSDEKYASKHGLSDEAAVDKITLDGVRGLRVTFSATVHDVLYYMSPVYCQDIIDSVWLLRTLVVIFVSIF